MSRIGKKPVNIPDGVKVEIKGHKVTVIGPKGTLSREFHPNIKIKIENNQVKVERRNDMKFNRALHGMVRAMINNMITGVKDGFEKRLEIHGMGYRAQLNKDKKLILQIGFSNPVEVTPFEGINFKVEGTNKIVVFGIDKEKVGEQAAKIRALRKPEPYKGNGIRYEGEYVRRKIGKKGA